MIVIVDYDTGNTRSLSQAFEKIGLKVKISNEPAVILAASGLILPGVGAFPKAMTALEERELIEPIKTAVANGTPLLGICLGMQLLFDKSLEYGETKGLGFISGQVIPFPEDLGLLIPHMGWNQLHTTSTNAFVSELNKEYVYYVHSYYVDCPTEYVLATSDYGVSVTGVVNFKNVYGTQFHPEKSGVIGQEILKEFKKVVEAHDRIPSN